MSLYTFSVRMAATSLQHWIQAARLRTLPLAIANVSMGAVLAKYFGTFDWSIYLMTTVTAILLQVLSNLANEYGDFIHGADHADRSGPSRTVQSGAISANAMKKAMHLTAGLSILSGVILICLTTLSIPMKIVFLALGLIAVWASINYTAGSNPYGYRGYGDVSVFLFFGLLSVLGSYYLQRVQWQWSILLPAISCGAFSMGVLNVNNIRDLESDAMAGKNSLALMMGRVKAVRYHALLLTIGIIASAVFTMIHFERWLQWFFLIITPLLIVNFRAVQLNNTPMELDPYLKQMALTTLLFVVTFGLGLLSS
jgi:1,4-dihydroxy-2-naphthoate octaprenyltransferase